MSGGRERERARRIGLNEAVFREVNERLSDLSASDSLDLICECGHAECDQRVALPRAEYETIRADPLLFAVVPGHEIDDVEDVVARRDGYDVVRKHDGEPAHVARATGPRAEDS